jgi:hypothetical protein
MSLHHTGEIYEDNMSRVFLIAVDESIEQTKKIIEYQNKKAAGLIDYKKEQEIKNCIQQFITFPATQRSDQPLCPGKYNYHPKPIK